VQHARRDYTRRLAAGFALKAIYRVFRYRLELGQANEIREVITFSLDGVKNTAFKISRLCVIVL